MSDKNSLLGDGSKKIRVGMVNYLNTKPLLYGLERKPISDRIELVGDYPSKVAQLLIVLPSLSEYHIIGDYCIGTQGEIASVALFSEVPMNEIKKVYLDYQSRTSVALLKYLMKEYWGIDPEIVESLNEDYRSEIKGTTAGLVIGDRALEQRKISTFIFAAWISKKQLPDEFIQLFNEANAVGLQHIDEIVAENPFDLYDLKKYYNLHLSYKLDSNKLKGMELFLSGLKTA